MIRNARLDIDAAFVRWVVEHLGVDRKEAIRQIIEQYMRRGQDSEEFGSFVIDDDGDLAVDFDYTPFKLKWPGESVRWLP